MQLDFEEERPSVQSVEVEASSADVAKRVHASDKRMINATTDVNQLVPFKYKWAWDMYLKACENNWMPQETSFEKDLEQLSNSNVMSPTETLAVYRSVAALTLGESGTGEVAMGIYRHITAPEGRQYLLRQGFEEVLLTHTYTHLIDQLKLDEDAVMSHRSQLTQEAKQRFFAPYLETLTNPHFRTDTLEGAQQFLKTLVVYTCALKGLFSISDFAQMLALGQAKKMVGVSTVYQNLLRDQMAHVAFGVEVINAIKSENPGVQTQDLRKELIELIQEALHLEMEHARALGLHESFNHLLGRAASRVTAVCGLSVDYRASSHQFQFDWLAGIMGLVDRRETTRTPAAENKISSTLDWE